MPDSILVSVKKSLSILDEYKEFDSIIIMHINSIFSTLHQLGVGPIAGFMIENDTETWDAFLFGDERLNAVKSYVYLKVRLLFDPPSTSFTITMMQEQIKELEWRLNVVREGIVYGTILTGGGSIPSGGVIDGGKP